ncbi:hypothetical protein [Sorangium sp. So ce1000]|uniref:hypothetical protein n=1 Tax=Sorangium sp. So ce1000 TaxID=3133325 RepID=UPI003F627623
MDFTTLQTTVNGQYSAAEHIFKFDPAPYGSAPINSLLTGVVSQRTWTLTGVTAAPRIDAQRQTVTVAGICGSFYGQAGAPLTMVFFLDSGGTPQLLIKLDLGAGWTFVTAFPELMGSIFQDVGFKVGTAPMYVFASADFIDATLENGAFVTGMNFYADIAPSSQNQNFNQVMSVLGSFANTTAVGPMSVVDGVPRMTLTLGVQSALSQYFPVLKNHVEVQLVCQLDETTNLVGLLLGTKFDLGANKALELQTLLTPAPLGVLTLTGQFTNVALPSPGEFAQDIENLIGANDLHSSLPSQYQNRADLYLQTITVGIGVSTAKPELVTLTIGMPAHSPGWQLGDFATVTGVSFSIMVVSPFDSAARSISVAVSGELDFPTASGSIDLLLNGWALSVAGGQNTYAVQAGLAPGKTLTLPVGDLVNKYLPSAVDLPDIWFDQLGVDFRFQSPKNHYGIYAGLDPKHPLTFRFGGASVFEVLYANVHIENDSYNGGPGGGIVGGIKIFSVVTDFAYQTPGAFKITALIPQFNIDVAAIASGLLDTPWTLPEWMPTITFPQTSLFIQRQGSGDAATYTFALLAKPSFGSIVLQVLKQRTGWTFAAGLELDAPKIAAFGSLSMLSGMDAMFKVDELLFVFASGDMASGFQFPLTTDFRGGSGKSIQIPTWAGQVKGGFYLYGSMTLNVAEKPNLALVQKMFRLDVNLRFQLFVFIGRHPEQNAMAQASFQGKINDTTTLFGILGARMEAGEPEFYLEGIVTTTIQGSDGPHTLVSKNQVGDDLTVGFMFELTEAAAFLSVSMIGSVVFGPITLSDMVLVVGIDFGGIPSLGFAAQIDLSLQGTTYDSSIAFFFDSGDVHKSMFAGSVSNVTLKQIADTIVGEVTGGDRPPPWLDALLAQVGISGTDTFYLTADAAAALNGRDYARITAHFNQATQSKRYGFSPQTTLLVVGQDDLHKPGVWYITDFPASNVITHYQLTAQADGRIQVSLEPQFYYCMPPGGGSVTLGPPGAGLTFNSGVFLSGQLDFFMVHLEAQLEIVPSRGFAADLEVTAPVVIIPSYMQLTGNQDTKRGPRFSMSTYTVQQTYPSTQQPVTQPAHFYLDGRIDFLGLDIATTVNITSAGLHIDLKATVGDAKASADLTIDTTLNRSSGFSFEIAADLHIDDPALTLFDGLGTLHLKVDMRAGLTFSVDSGGGVSLRVSDAKFDFEGVGFTIPGFDMDVTTQQLKDLPGIIYDEAKNLVSDFMKDAEHWLAWIDKGVITGYKDIESVLEDVYNAISSVWGNEKRIVVAVHESFANSQSTTITISPPQPTATVTQAMIAAAQAWAEQTAEFLVTQAVVDQIKQISPEDVGNFQISSVQNIDETYRLAENVGWPAVAQGQLPSLTSLGYQDPFADQRFYTRATTQPKFMASIAVDADFANTVRQVTVTVRYHGVNVGAPYTFTSAVPHQFTADWVASAGNNFQVQYTVTFLNPQTPQISSGWLNQKGPTLILPVAQPIAGSSAETL